MRLTRLELSGFKSFADSIDLPFEDGVTCIVGPNGCGKSNISDAVRWVLGEQRARMLRGAKMEEVIFQGSTKRKALNVAEVSLYFDNSEGTLPIAYREVVVTRRLSRSGQSEYLLNQTPTRLKDVQDLLRGTGLGSDAGVVIEAKMIDRLLSDRTDERRSLFEEAAGVGLYRDRKSITERRLEQTMDDLQRLDDVISEVHTQVRSLARQRGKAERHHQFVQERFRVVIELARRDLTRFDEQDTDNNRRRAELADDLPSKRTALQEQESRREQLAQARATQELQRTELERKLAEARLELGRLEGDLNLARERLQHADTRRTRAQSERQQAEAAAAQAELEMEAAQEDLRAAREARESVQIELDLRAATEDETRQRVATQREEVRHLADQLHEAVESLRAMSGEQSSIEKDLEELGRQRSEAAERVRITTESHEEIVARLDGAKADLAAFERGVAGTETALADARQRVTDVREHESRLSSERRQTEEVLSQATARRDALAALEKNREGLAPAARALLEHRHQFGDGAVLGPLSDFVDVTPMEASRIERTLGEWLHAVLVRDENVARAVAGWHETTRPGPLLLLPISPGPQTEHRESAVTIAAREPATRWTRALVAGVSPMEAAGVALRRANGAIFLPGGADDTGPLQRRAELERIRQQVADGEADMQRLTQALESAASDHAAAERALTVAEDQHEEARAALRNGRATCDDLVRELQRVDRDREAAVDAISRIDERTSQRRHRLSELQQSLSLVKQQQATMEAEIENQRHRLSHVETEQETARERRVHWQVEEAQVSARETAARDRVDRAESARSRAREAIGQLGNEMREIDDSVESLHRQLSAGADQSDERRIEVHELEAASSEASASVHRADESLRQCEEQLEAMRSEVEQLTGEMHELEIRHTEAAGRRQALIERIEGEWHRPFSELLEAADPIDEAREALEARNAELRETLERLGPVNPLAAQEYEEEQKRLDFLQTQREDLTEARKSLHDSLREIEHTANEMFLETFERIKEHFERVFLTLFEGGECGLNLADPSDPLSSEIEIKAAPRGKRTQRIHLLSSGERALVAISLLFAIYLAKPSPFCLLDEVDAPLDDANVQRFIRLLTEFKMDTQFIVITHNPRTMQTADAVYGVTMQEPGVSTIVGVRLAEHAAV